MEIHNYAVNGIHLCVHEAGPEHGRPVWLLHGFPECWHSWRFQVPALTAAGYRVLVPEMRGYGRSDAPRDPAAYELLTLCGDIRAVMDYLGQKEAVVVGHDWGAPVAWHTALLEPERVKAVVGMSVPFGGRPKASPLQYLRKHYEGRFNYILYFQTPGVAEAELDADIRRTLRLTFHNWSAAVPANSFLRDKPADARLFDGALEPDGWPAWMSEADFEEYVRTFEGRGFYGGLNWYRNFDRNWERTAPLASRRIEQPALFLIGDKDPVRLLEANSLSRMPSVVPRVEQHVLEDCGHWTQVERAAEVNAHLLDFLGRHYPA